MTSTFSWWYFWLFRHSNFDFLFYNYFLGCFRHFKERDYFQLYKILQLCSKLFSRNCKVGRFLMRPLIWHVYWLKFLLCPCKVWGNTSESFGLSSSTLHYFSILFNHLLNLHLTKAAIVHSVFLVTFFCAQWLLGINFSSMHGGVGWWWWCFSCVRYLYHLFYTLKLLNSLLGLFFHCQLGEFQITEALFPL